MRQCITLLILLIGKISFPLSTHSVELISDEDFHVLAESNEDHCVKAKHYLSLNEISVDSSLYYLDLAERFSQSCDDFVMKAELNYELGTAFKKDGLFSEARISFGQALNQYVSLKDTQKIAGIYSALGVICKKERQLAQALSFFNKAAAYYYILNDKQGIASVELNIGLILKNLDRTEEAKVKYHNALKINQELENHIAVADCQNNLGNIFKNEAAYDSAFYYLYHTLSSRLLYGPDRKLGFVYHNLGNLHSELKNYDSAHYYYNSSIDIKKKMGNKSELASSYFVYGIFNMEQNNPHEAIEMYEKAKQLYVESKTFKMNYSLSKKLGDAYYAIGNYKASADNYALSYVQEDSFNTINNAEQIKNELIQYEFFKDSLEKEKMMIEHQLNVMKNKNEELTNASVKQQLYYSLILIGSLIIMLALLIFSFKKRLRQARLHRGVLAKQNEELKRTLVSKEEKETLLKEIHHRVKNNLQIISSLVRLQSDYINQTNFRERLNETENRIRSMALIHEKLYQSENLSKLGIQGYIQELSVNILESYEYKSQVEFKFDIDARDFTIDTLIPIGLILNETISNALKYAFIGQKENGIITIRMKKSDEQGYVMMIEDNGVGADTSVDKLKEGSLGMDLIFSLAEQLDGTLDVDTSDGFNYTFSFPNLTQ